MDFGDQRLHKLSAFLFIHHGVQLIKVNQNFVDINFAANTSFNIIFGNGYEVDSIIKNISLLKPNINFEEGNTY